MTQYDGSDRLEAALAGMGRGMTYGPTPDFGPAVLAALDQAGAPRSRFLPGVQGATARLVLITALALVLLACAAAGAYYVSTQIRLTAETSIGTWVWTRVDGDETSLPFGRVNFVDGRYYVLEEPIEWKEGNVLPGTWWVSADGLTWRHEASGAPPGSLLEPRGADIWYAWPSPFEDDPVILRREGGEWVPAEFPAAPAPEIAGMQWNSSFWNFVRSGEVTVALAPAAGWVDWQAVYGDLYIHAEWRDTTSGVLELWAFEDPWSEDRELLAVLRMSVAGDPGEVQFHDYQTGERVLRLAHGAGPGITPEQLAAQFRRDEGFLVAYAWSLLVDDGAGYRVVEAPWRDLADTLLVNVAAGPGGFIAIAVDSVDAHTGDGKPLLYTWRSSDGEVWEEIGSPVSISADIAPFADLQGDDDEVFMVLYDHHNLRPRLWRLNESGWQQVEGVRLDHMGGGMGTGPNRVGPGWALVAFHDPGSFPEETVCQVWVSPDGADWEQVPVAANFPPSIYQDDSGSLKPVGIAFSTNCGITGDAAFAMWAVEDGTRTLWMGRFEE
jgi:hypothetical protein